MVAFVMMNVLIGAIIEALSGVRAEMIREALSNLTPI